jgi:hypothetical protein
MKIENTKVFNIEGAFRGMRNPLDSWAKSDSEFGFYEYDDDDISWDVAEKYYSNPNWRNYNDPELREAEEEIEKNQTWLIEQGCMNCDDYKNIGYYNFIGPKDMDLAQRLIKSGPEHRKFLRQIIVSFDLTAPFYFWKEFDTYKVATVANSCSTMHKLTSYPIDVDNFEIEDFNPDLVFWTNDNGDSPVDYEIRDHIEDHMFFLEKLRQKYLETKDKRYWKELVRWLPEGWLQKRTITLNYETLRSMWIQRHNHKLTEWHTFCNWIESLPYAKNLILYDTVFMVP